MSESSLRIKQNPKRVLNEAGPAVASSSTSRLRSAGDPQATSPASLRTTGSSLIDFYGYTYLINPDVLIPRAETEQMVDAVLNLVGKAYLPGVRPSEAKLPKDLTIIDVGTGSGCVAVTLKLELPEATVVATDISEKALKVARENAKRLGAEVEFRQTDLLDEVEVRMDIVVANLPYVDENWEWIDKKALSKEPSLALYAEDGGLTIIKRLIDQVAEHDVKHLILEADPCQHERIQNYAKKKGLTLSDTRGFILCFHN